MMDFLFSLQTAARRALNALRAEAKRDGGALALIIAMALIALAASILAMSTRQNMESKVQRRSANAQSVKLVKDSVLAYYLSGTEADPSAINHRLPCPDTDMPPDGEENGTTTCDADTGVLPWVSLHLTQSDVVDAYGNYYTYAVTGNDTARSLCASVANSYNSSLVEFTGTLNDATDTEVRLSSESSGSGAPYYYAIISHGKNGLGAISAAGSMRAAPTSSAEIQNCPSSNTNCTDPSALTVISGPASDDSSSYFDDTVYVASTTQLTAMCGSLTPGGAVNADVKEEFTNTAVGSLPSDTVTAVTGTVNVQDSVISGNTGNRVLRFVSGNAAVRAASSSLSTAERARYMSFQWTPTTLGTSNTAGISAGMRATPADRNTDTGVGTYSADIFDTNTLDGITVRFFTDVADNANGATANNIFICDDTTAACDSGTNLAISSGTFTLTDDATYTVEVYDDGVQVWGRITQNNLTTNTATVSLTSVAAANRDMGNTNTVVLMNYSNATAELDSFYIGRGGMGVRFDGTDDVILTGSDAHDTTTGNLTLEAWIKPTALPTTGQATIISKWIEGGANTAQAYRLYIRSDGGITLQLAGTPGTGVALESHNFGGYTAKVGQWDHIAVTYNGTGSTDRAAKLYVNRELIARSASTSFAQNGVRNGTARFSVGAERDTVPNIVNEFTGDITDVRVWDVQRTAAEIFTNYNRRLPMTSGSLTGLIINWPLDRDTNGTVPTFTTTSATETLASSGTANGTLTNNAVYVSIPQRYIPVFASASFCASGSSQGTVVGAFKCEYRLADQSTSINVPNNLASLHVKVWGGGGGGYVDGANDSTGGGGGFSAGKLYTINGTDLVGRVDVRVDIGGGGAASTGRNNGAGGGGASGLWQDTNVDDILDPGTDFTGVISGGGGGASFGDDNMGTGGNPDCDTEGNCGPGGGGGGSSTNPGRAPDENSNRCGGRGGNTTNFASNVPHATNCEGGGADPTSTAGASGGGSAAGGVSVLGSGGAGYDGVDDGPAGNADEIGGGGGGGGVRTAAMTSGGGEAGAYDSGTIDNDGGVPDDNGSGFGGGGGDGFDDSATIGATGESARSTITVGNDASAGGASDPDYAGTGYCTSGGSPCSSTPGRGGESSSSAGKPGAVILQW